MADTIAAKVLVVEDDAAVLRLVETLLGHDFVVFARASAEEGLEVLRKERVHAVLSDHMLSGMSGVELLLEASKLQPHAARILMTASGRVEDAQEAINRARVKRFLAKPFRKEALLGMVGEAVHEVALAEIKDRLVKELKERAQVLSAALSETQAREGNLSAELASKKEQLEGLALRDALTGLYNHRFFQEALSAELRRARRRKQPVGLVLLDVQGFRAFNRKHSFTEGDALLQKLGTLIARALDDEKSPVELAARYGADTFALIAPGAEVDEVRSMADALINRSRAIAPEAPLRAAVAFFPADGESEDALLSSLEARLEGDRSR